MHPVIRSLALTIAVPVPRELEGGPNIVRADDADGPWFNATYMVRTDIQTGPDSGANAAIARVIKDNLRRAVEAARAAAPAYRVEGVMLFYVAAEFEGSEKNVFFRTIIRRQPVPLSLRNL
jgi:hypothetical protein